MYFLYGLVDQDLTVDESLNIERVKLGQRAFEYVLAEKVEQGKVSTAWFERHRSSPSIVHPMNWSDDYIALVQKRKNYLIDESWLSLVDCMTFKRRWNVGGILEQQKDSLNKWFLNKIESLLKDNESDTLTTVALLSDAISQDSSIQEVVASYDYSEFGDFGEYVEKLVSKDSCPQVSKCRLALKAMPKFREWQETWVKQRLADTIDVEFGVDRPISKLDANNVEKSAAYELAKIQAKRQKLKVAGDISSPPKYSKSDFQSPSYWQLRGKLDVPKERFFSLPGCEKDGDASFVIGWAGMNHLQRAKAIASWYLDRKERDGWEVEKLTHMLVAIDELIPWLKQWHNEINPEFGERMGDYYEGFLLEELRQLNISRDDLLNWEAPKARKNKRAAKTKKATAE